LKESEEEGGKQERYLNEVVVGFLTDLKVCKETRRATERRRIGESEREREKEN